MTFPTKSVSNSMAMESSDPLISTIVTLYALILLYFPSIFHQIVTSPVFISTSLLLLSLLRLGATQKISQKHDFEEQSLQVSRDFAYHDDGESVSNVDTGCEKDLVFDPDPNPNVRLPSLQVSCDFADHDDDDGESNTDSKCGKDSVSDDPDPNPNPNPNVRAPSLQASRDFVDHDDGEANVDPKCEKDPAIDDPDPNPNPRRFYADSFVEWNVRAPLEVIYEAYEGEEEEGSVHEKREAELAVIEKYASLSLYYPETDTDDSSSAGGESPVIGDWDSPENACFRWSDEDEEDREGLIEIELDGKRNNEVEEENLIEIDLSPASFPTSR